MFGARAVSAVVVAKCQPGRLSFRLCLLPACVCVHWLSKAAAPANNLSIRRAVFVIEINGLVRLKEREGEGGRGSIVCSSASLPAFCFGVRSASECNGIDLNGGPLFSVHYPLLLYFSILLCSVLSISPIPFGRPSTLSTLSSYSFVVFSPLLPPLLLSSDGDQVLYRFEPELLLLLLLPLGLPICSALESTGGDQSRAEEL